MKYSGPEIWHRKAVARLFLASLLLACGGCGTQRPSLLPSGPAAYRAIPVRLPSRPLGLVEPGDRLEIRVLGEPELTSDQYFVDPSGIVQMPLAGDIRAEGRSVEAVRDEIAARLGRRYIRDPQVTVSVAQRHKELLTVEGQVREPGRYEAASGMTLLGAIAMAKGTSTSAKINEVLVMRDEGGQELGARFNLDDIRVGRAPDPQVIEGDKIVVGFSASKSAWHDFLQAAPLFNIFYLVH